MPRPQHRRGVVAVVLFLFAALIVFIASTTVAVHQGIVRIPPSVAPWPDIDLEVEASWLTRLQLNSLTLDDNACYAALDRSELVYTRLPALPIEEGCGYETAAHIERSHVPYSTVVDATCPLVAALYLYELRLDALAQLHLGTRLARIDHYGTYACRYVGGDDEGRRSEHASANAIDIGGFRFADGTVVSVLDDWRTDTAKGRFLMAARDEACQLFNTVLSPDYNEAHRNHFHLDFARFHLCH